MPLSISSANGLNTAKDPRDLAPGEVVRATGIWYKPGDQVRSHKIGGVTAYGDTSTGKAIDGLALLQFDEGGTDKIVALSDKALYGSDISSSGASGTFTSLKSGLGTLATSLSAAQFNDRWYLALGSENLVVESDGTTRSMGMRAPSLPKVAADTGGTLERPTASAGDFTDPELAYDASSPLSTYGYVSRTTAGSSTQTYSGWGSEATSDRVLAITWALAGIQIIPDFPSDGDFDDVGGTLDSGFLVDVKFEYSEDAGVTWTEFFNDKNVYQPRGSRTAQVPITDSLDVQTNLEFRATLKYNTGDTAAVLRILDINVNDGGTAATFTVTTGIYYALAEWDANRGLLSPVTAHSDDVPLTFTTKNFVKVTLPSSANNSTATHWRIYRTNDGGTLPADLGLAGQVPIANTSFIDDYSLYDKDTIPKPLYPLIRTVFQADATSSTPLYFDLTSPPRRFAVLRSYEGSLVGLSAEKTRALYYSAAGKPEYWPEINVIDSFPFEEHDELVNCAAIGTTLIIAAKGTIMRLTSLPRVVNSVRDASRVEQIRGAPGCVGRYAFTTYSVSGAPRAAWISPYGVYITNGDQITRISDDIDWSVFDGVDKSRWVLHWDAKRLCLIMQTEGTDGDRYYLLHLNPEHQKPNGNPKWTGPHYGNFRCYTSGQVASTHRLLSGHSTDGSVYVMDRGGLDNSQAYSGTTLPLDVLTGELQDEEQDFSALDGFLHHTDFGGGQTATLDFTVGNDYEDGGGITITQSVSLKDRKREQVDFAVQAQWAQVRLRHSGAGQGAFGELLVNTVARGRSGSKRVA